FSGGLDHLFNAAVVEGSEISGLSVITAAVGKFMVGHGLQREKRHWLQVYRDVPANRECSLHVRAALIGIAAPQHKLLGYWAYEVLGRKIVAGLRTSQRDIPFQIFGRVGHEFSPAPQHQYDVCFATESCAQ